MTNAPRLAASDGAVVRATPPSLLEIVKDDLGIPPADTTNDAWLQRRIDGVWARFEKYCCRLLPSPPAKFLDDWGAISQHSNWVQPPAIDYPHIGSPFLRYSPVTKIDAITSNGQVLDPTQVIFEAATGKLFALDGVVPWSRDVSHALRTGQVKITYYAGWDTVPADLYEALLGCLTPLWTARVSQAAGGGVAGGTLSSINVVDVGQVDFDASSPFLTAAMRGVADPGAGDPLLGPWTTLLNNYMDVRVQMGSPLIPTTVAVP
jgi:hypothetical protein